MKSKAQTVREYMNVNPDATTAEVAKKCKVTRQYVYQVKSDERKRLAKKLNARLLKVCSIVIPLPLNRLHWVCGT